MSEINTEIADFAGELPIQLPPVEGYVVECWTDTGDCHHWHGLIEPFRFKCRTIEEARVFAAQCRRDLKDTRWRGFRIFKATINLELQLESTTRTNEESQ